MARRMLLALAVLVLVADAEFLRKAHEKHISDFAFDGRWLSSSGTTYSDGDGSHAQTTMAGHAHTGNADGDDTTSSAGTALSDAQQQMFGGCGNEEASKSYAVVNYEMHAGMAINFTGNAEFDFLAGMIPHHAGASEMCDIYEGATTQPGTRNEDICCGSKSLCYNITSGAEKWGKHKYDFSQPGETDQMLSMIKLIGMEKVYEDKCDKLDVAGTASLTVSHNNMPGRRMMNDASMNHDGIMSQTSMGDTGISHDGMSQTSMGGTGMSHDGMGDAGSSSSMGHDDMSQTSMGDTGMSHDGMSHDGMDDAGSSSSSSSSSMGHDDMSQTSMGDTGMSHDGMSHDGMDDAGSSSSMGHDDMSQTSMGDTGMSHDGMSHDGMDDAGSSSSSSSSSMGHDDMSQTSMGDTGMSHDGMSHDGMDDAGSSSSSSSSSMGHDDMSQTSMGDTGMSHDGMSHDGMDDAGSSSSSSSMGHDDMSQTSMGDTGMSHDGMSHDGMDDAGSSSSSSSMGHDGMSHDDMSQTSMGDTGMSHDGMGHGSMFMGCGHLDLPMTKDYIELNMKMHTQMALNFTGDPAVDFLLGMIPHHAAAADMCAIYYKYWACTGSERPDICDNLMPKATIEELLLEKKFDQIDILNYVNNLCNNHILVSQPEEVSWMKKELKKIDASKVAELDKIDACAGVAHTADADVVETADAAHVADTVDPPSCATRCGPGTIYIGNQCIGTSATCAGLWAGAVTDAGPHYRRDHQCQCNDLCVHYGNCCMDAEALKHSEEKTCADLGHPQYYMHSNPCQCNQACHKKEHSNCCRDAKAPKTCEELGDPQYYVYSNACQCNARCHVFDNCCADAKAAAH